MIFLKNTKLSLLPTFFHACHQKQSQKNLMNEFWEKSQFKPHVISGHLLLLIFFGEDSCLSVLVAGKRYFFISSENILSRHDVCVNLNSYLLPEMSWNFILFNAHHFRKMNVILENPEKTVLQTDGRTDLNLQGTQAEYKKRYSTMVTINSTIQSNKVQFQ